MKKTLLTIVLLIPLISGCSLENKPHIDIQKIDESHIELLKIIYALRDRRMDFTNSDLIEEIRDKISE